MEIYLMVINTYLAITFTVFIIYLRYGKPDKRIDEQIKLNEHRDEQLNTIIKLIEQNRKIIFALGKKKGEK